MRQFRTCTSVKRHGSPFFVALLDRGFCDLVAPCSTQKGQMSSISTFLVLLDHGFCDLLAQCPTQKLRERLSLLSLISLVLTLQELVFCIIPINIRRGSRNAILDDILDIGWNLQNFQGHFDKTLLDAVVRFI